ncbi:hypothetical protein E1211_28990 [Micromonospora sp. 15K316]|uniref:hypothetical protein n=1 Tax=Micromonospora sp. 15K316 TaxID=2530376 RepID=UPI00105061B7|nr:hypothetical protein [Micromonospora sp. 15K316]TDC27659.1 hypothetical protein E1211_28990 [Micromonospora sp. 15K316]
MPFNDHDEELPPGEAQEQEVVRYYVYPDGSYSMLTLVGGAGVVPPDATEITQAEYEAGVAAVNAANEALAEQQLADDRALAEADFEALVAAGIPEATARRLSGFSDDETS